MIPSSESKIGDGHASAMLRQGLRELRGSMYTQSNVAQNPEYGLYGTLTPGEVAASRQGNELSPDQEVPSNQSALETRMSQSAGRSSPKMEVNVPGMDR